MKKTFSFIVLAIVLTLSATFTFGQTPEANPRCSDFGYNRSVKIDNAPFATTVNLPFGSITTTVSGNATLSWQSTQPAFVRAVILKGGADATVKHYAPPVWFDSNITTPINSSGNPAGISHVEFCYRINPSAAPVSLTGRVLDKYRRPISGAVVRSTDMNGAVQVAYTNTFGYYKFAELKVSEGYVFDVTARRYIFGAQFLSLQDSLTGFDFVAQ